MIHKKKISPEVIHLAQQKMDELDQLNNSYLKVLNYQRWTINEETVEDLIVNNDFLEQLNKVYIGNLKVVKKDLLSLLKQFGPFTYKFIPSKECMFVDFDNPNAACLCIRELKGFKVGRTPSYPTEIPSEYKNPDPTIFYFSNLPKDISEESLMDIFPEVEFVKMSYNGTFEHRGYCYIKFKSVKIAEKIIGFYSELSFHKQKIFMCQLVVKIELPEFKTPKLSAGVERMKRQIDSRIFRKGNILKLTNLIEYYDFDTDFKNEIEFELSKHGVIDHIDFNVDIEVTVVCRFKTQIQCRQAFDHLNGRFFGGRRINAMICEGFNN